MAGGHSSILTKRCVSTVLCAVCKIELSGSSDRFIPQFKVYSSVLNGHCAGTATECNDVPTAT